MIKIEIVVKSIRKSPDIKTIPVKIEDDTIMKKKKLKDQSRKKEFEVSYEDDK